jgi:hypothetical protein
LSIKIKKSVHPAHSRFSGTLFGRTLALFLPIKKENSNYAVSFLNAPACRDELILNNPGIFLSFIPSAMTFVLKKQHVPQTN